jgi:predicted nucleotidyltransferase
MEPLAPRVKVAFIFGSMAQARETANSDVDVMVIGDVTFSDIVQLLHPAQATLGREINPRVFTADEWCSKVAKADAFVQDVAAKPKIFVIGSDHELAELARHQS